MRILILIILLLTLPVPSFSATDEARYGHSKFKRAKFGVDWRLKYVEHKTSFTFDKTPCDIYERFRLAHRISLKNHKLLPPMLTNYYEIFTDSDFATDGYAGVILGLGFSPNRKWDFDIGIGAQGQSGGFVRGGASYVW